MPDESSKRIAYKRIVAAATRPWEGKQADFRIALVAERAGLRKSADVINPISSEVVAAVRDPQHQRRIPGPAGPIVFLRSAENPRQGDAVFVPELICAPDNGTRDAAISHLEREIGAASSYLSPWSESLIKEYADDVRSADAARWVTAAMRLDRALEGDFHLNRAAFKQGLSTSLPVILDTHWPRLMRPAPESLWSIRNDGYELLKPRNKFDAAMDRMLDESTTVLDLLRTYDRELGHLPLHASRGVGNLARRWLGHRSDLDTPGAVSDWSNSSLYPGRMIQGCEVLLAIAHEFTNATGSSLLKRMLTILARAPDDEEGRLASELLAFEADLARHYFRYLEVRAIGMDVDRIGTVSWWAAKAVAEAISEEAHDSISLLKFVEPLRKRNLQPELDVSQFTWQLAHPRAGSGSIRYATLFIRQPRLLALLLEMRDSLDRLPIDISDAGLLRGFTGAFADQVLGCFPIVDLESAESIWAFDRPLYSSFKAWLNAGLDEELRGRMRWLVDLSELAADIDRRSEAFKELPNKDGPAQTFLVHLLRVLAYTENEVAPLWEIVLDKPWYQGCFRNLGEVSVEALFDGAMELARRIDDPRRTEIPHLFAEVLESDTHELSRRSWFLAFTIVASANAGTVSAVRRAMRTRSRTELTQTINSWRSRIQAILPVLPALVAARLRDVLSSLR